MKLKFVVPMTLAAASLALARPALAQTYTETGDAGDLPTTAQIVTGVAGATYTSIAGATTATNALYDSDMYEITTRRAGNVHLFDEQRHFYPRHKQL